VGDALLRGFRSSTTISAPAAFAGQFLIDDQQAARRHFGDVADLVARESEVDRQEHRAEMAGGEDELQERRAVLHQHGHDVARADALRGEPAGRLPDARIEIGVGDLLAAIFQRGPVRRAPGMKVMKLERLIILRVLGRLPASFPPLMNYDS
jgi:hypothetical protein